MILVLAGTQDGRELAAALTAASYPVTVSVFSGYGRELAAGSAAAVQTGPMDEAAMTEFIDSHKVRLVIDASHPYAVNVSQNAMAACRHSSCPYLRYERSLAAMPDYPGLTVVSDYQAAAKAAARLGQTVFLTTGSRHLKIFKTEPALQGCRLIARVLPEPSVIEECLLLGFTPKDIVGLQGPFSQELNAALFSHYQADVIVTKNSGTVGGSDTKVAAAMALKLPIVMIDRPGLDYPNAVDSIDAARQFVKEMY